MKTISTFLLITIAATCTFSQDYNDYPVRPFQFTLLFPPISTNGLSSGRSINNVSINTFIGHSAANTGFEVAGFLNTEKHFVKGFQVSGFANIVGGEVNALQLAGFSNVNADKTKGFQSAGFANVVLGQFDGFQSAGFANYNQARTKGFLTAGFVNVVGDDFKGVQVAGFSNINLGYAKGLQIAGFTNINTRGHSTLQISGFFNYTGNIKGIQTAGFANIAKKVKGIQVAGFINVCDSIDGFQLGFINIPRKQLYMATEISTSESLYMNVAYKLGARHLYNIYSLGKLSHDANRWAYGFGMGTEFDLNSFTVMNIEGIAHQELWIGQGGTGSYLHTDRLNMLNQIKTIFGFRLVDNLVIFAGPTLNVSVANTHKHSHPYSRDDMAPAWYFYSHTGKNHDKTQVKMWIGFNAGLRI